MRITFEIPDKTKAFHGCAVYDDLKEIHMAEKTNLKPCPFCGGIAELYSVPQGNPLSPLSWIVICNKCECRTAIEISDHDAENAWNRRVK